MEKLPFAKCDQCPLKDRPVVPPYGPLDADIIVVAEAPGGTEVTQGRPLCGPSGKLLDACISGNGFDPKRIYRTNVVACRPPQNILPNEGEIEACGERLLEELRHVSAPTIVALGKVAKIFLTGIDGDRGMWFHINRNGINKDLLTTWHPAYVLRKPTEASRLNSDLRRAYEGPKTLLPYPDPNGLHISVPRTTQELSDCLDSIRGKSDVSFDIETNNVVWYDRPGAPANSILMLSITDRLDGAIVIDDEMLYDIKGVSDVLNRFFARRDLTFVGQNAKFDIIFLEAQVGVRARCDFDTMLAHYGLDETKGTHDLKQMAAEHFGWPDYEGTLVKRYLENKNDEYSKVPFSEMSKYSALDAIATLGLKTLVLAPELEKANLREKPFELILMPLQHTAKIAEMRGIQIDEPYVRDASSKFAARLEQLHRQMEDTCGIVFNPNSTAQLANIIYDYYHFPYPTNPNLPMRSTNHEVLEPLAGHVFIDLLLKYRRITKLKSSYLDNLLEFMDVNGRIHPTWLLHGTETGRLAMRDPAAQTVPRPTPDELKGKPDYDPFEDGATIRGAIIAGPGKVLAIVDYSQAELRGLAAESLDPFLLKVYQDGRDLHSEVAAKMFGPNYTKEQRVRCKMFNFSWAYGGNEYSFAQDQGLNIAVARTFVREYNKVMAGAVQWKKDQFERLKSQGYIASRFGYRRRFPLITDGNRNEAEKAAVNMPIQNLATSLTSLSAIRLTEMDPERYAIVLPVHDSIVAEVNPETAEEDAQTISQVMLETAAKYVPEVPWKVDPEVRERWAEPPSLSLPKVTHTNTAI